MKIIASTELLTECQTFKLVCLLEEREPDKEPWLEIFPGEDNEKVWDNSNYLRELNNDLKDNHKGMHYKELKKFCKKNKLEFKETKKILIGLFKQAKKHKML
jgi:hypothetical protein